MPKNWSQAPPQMSPLQGRQAVTDDPIRKEVPPHPALPFRAHLLFVFFGGPFTLSDCLTLLCPRRESLIRDLLSAPPSDAQPLVRPRCKFPKPLLNKYLYARRCLCILLSHSRSSIYLFPQVPLLFVCLLRVPTKTEQKWKALWDLRVSRKETVF